MRLSRRRLLVSAVGLAAGWTFGAPPVAAAPGLDHRSVARVIAEGVGFLTRAQPLGQYSPQHHLLREAPSAAPCKYWLFNDNALAGHLLARMRHPLWAVILAELKRYGHETNGLHEVLWGVRAGETLDWMPCTHDYLSLTPELDDGACSQSCAELGADIVCTEVRRGTPMPDWQEYADLALLGALNQALLHERKAARRTFATAMGMFDWAEGGFVDKASVSGEGYLTYKVGLALHVGLTLGAVTRAQAGALAEILCAQQESAIAGKVGGFYTHYGQTGARTCDVNTETTALALWGLWTYRS